MDELNVVPASTYEFLNNAYDKLMDKNEFLIEENKRLNRYYDITNESWKQLQIENIKLHRIVEYIKEIINKPFSVYLINRSEYNQLKELLSEIEELVD